jgi:hypothetical protein
MDRVLGVVGASAMDVRIKARIVGIFKLDAYPEYLSAERRSSRKGSRRAKLYFYGKESEGTTGLGDTSGKGGGNWGISIATYVRRTPVYQKEEDL